MNWLKRLFAREKGKTLSIAGATYYLRRCEGGWDWFDAAGKSLDMQRKHRAEAERVIYFHALDPNSQKG